MKTYIVCMDPFYVRDAQMFRTDHFTEDELDEVSIYNEDDHWCDMEPIPFIGITMAENEHEACHIIGTEKRYDPKCLYATDIAQYIHCDKIHVDVDGGQISATVNPDPAYPGIDVEFIPGNDQENSISQPRVLMERPLHEELRLLIWDDPNAEDYTKVITFKENHESYPRKVVFRNLLEENGTDIHTGLLHCDGTISCLCGCNGTFEKEDYEILPNG